MAAISQELVRALMENPSPENRERSVMQLTEAFRSRALNGCAASMLEEVIRIFAQDAAVRVRKAVAEELKQDPLLPYDIALSLAHDVDEVAMPVLRFSTALSDDDLTEIVVKEGQKKLQAIAARESVGARFHLEECPVGPAVAKQLEIAIERTEVHVPLAPERVVEAPATDPHSLHEVIGGCGLIPLLPEHVHRAVQRFVAVELSGASGHRSITSLVV